MIANTNRNPRKAAFKPGDFDPYVARDRKQKAPSIDVLKVLLTAKTQ